MTLVVRDDSGTHRLLGIADVRPKWRIAAAVSDDGEPPPRIRTTVRTFLDTTGVTATPVNELEVSLLDHQCSRLVEKQGTTGTGQPLA
jgi:hypothetical protein